MVWNVLVFISRQEATAPSSTHLIDITSSSTVVVIKMGERWGPEVKSRRGENGVFL